MQEINICVVGAGRWGGNHIRTLNELGYLGGVVDPLKEKREKFREQFPQITCFNSLQKSFRMNYDGYIVATPPNTHVDLVKEILKQKIPVLVEKPLALSIEDGLKIKSSLNDLNGKLLVGHLLLFHPAIIKIKKMIEEGLIGDLQYIYSNRLNLGVVRKEENVFWSFAPHDISLFQFFTGSFPVEIQSSGGAFLQKNIYDTLITYLKYPNGVEGHIYVSWLHPFKEHRLVVIGSKGSLYFEDSADPPALLFYEKENKIKSNILLLKNKPSKLIEYEKTQPLTNELIYFVNAIKGEDINKATIDEGLDVVKILQFATNSINSNN